MSVPPSQANTSDQAASFSAFISYATKADKAEAFEIASHLEALGLTCWIAPRNVRPGKQYAGEIVRGIATSRCFILVLSNAANDSKFVRREVEQADRKDKPVYTIRIQEVDPSEDLQLFLSEIHWIDAFEGKLAAHVKLLAEMLRDEERSASSIEAAASEAIAPPIAGRAESREPPPPKPVRVERPATKSAPLPRGSHADANIARVAATDSLGDVLISKWVIFVLRGALALIVGLGYEFSLWGYFDYHNFFVGLIAAYLVADAILAAAVGIGRGSARWRYLFVVEGLISLAFGVLIAAAPSVLSTFSTLIASWALGTGAVRGLAASRLTFREGKVWLAFGAAASLALGVVLLTLATPVEEAGRWVAGWVCAFLIPLGASYLVLGFHLDGRKLAAAPAEQAAALSAAGAVLAPFWWAFAARAVLSVCAGALFWWFSTREDLLNDTPVDTGLAWVRWLGVYMIACGAATIAPGLLASRAITRWRVLIAESAIIIVGGLVVFFNGGSVFGFVALAYQVALVACGLLLFYAACGLDLSFGRRWLAGSGFVLLLFPLAQLAAEWVENIFPIPGRREAFIGWAGSTAFLSGGLFAGLAFRLRRSASGRRGVMASKAAGEAVYQRPGFLVAKGLLLIAGGLPFLLWYLFPDLWLWNAGSIPGLIVVPLTLCMILSGGLALAPRARSESGAAAVLGGAAGVLIGTASLAWMLFSGEVALSGFPSNAPFLVDQFDPLLAGWAVWASLSGGLLLVSLWRLKGPVSRIWLMLASAASLLLGLVFFLAATDLLDQETVFFLYVGLLAGASGAFLVLFAMSPRVRERMSPAAA